MQKLEREWLTPEAIVSLTSDPLRVPFVSEPQLCFDDRRRLRFWEIEGVLKCPVVGWCLDLAEQKEVLRKEGISIKGKSNLEIHEILVKSLEDESPLSRKIDFWLNRKYRKEIDELSSLEPEEFIKLWEASLDKDEFDGLLWVAVTKGDLSAEARKDIFADVHMETHQRAKELGNERQRLRQERENNESLAESAKELSQINRKLKKENEKISNELAIASRLSSSLQRQHEEMQKELSQENEGSLTATLQKENAQLRAAKDEMTRQTLVYQKEVRRLENRNNKLLSKLNKQLQMRFQRSDEAESSSEQISGPSRHESAASIDLSKRRILVVGGLSKMEAPYRRLIERNGGIFEHHDGRMNTGPGAKELVNQVRRSHLVLCCVDHSSHTSSLVVKKLCKKYDKPLRILINSSLNNILLTLIAFKDEFTIQMDRKNMPFKIQDDVEA